MTSRADSSCNPLASQLFKAIPYLMTKKMINDELIVGRSEIVGDFSVVICVSCRWPFNKACGFCELCIKKKLICLRRNIRTITSLNVRWDICVLEMIEGVGRFSLIPARNQNP